MATQSTSLTSIASNTQPRTARYCGLAIEVIEEMEYCSLIRCRNRKYIINTEDLEITTASAHLILNLSVVGQPGREHRHEAAA
jgi:hypothetical protein